MTQKDRLLLVLTREKIDNLINNLTQQELSEIYGMLLNYSKSLDKKRLNIDGRKLLMQKKSVAEVFANCQKFTKQIKTPFV